MYGLWKASDSGWTWDTGHVLHRWQPSSRPDHPQWSPRAQWHCCCDFGTACRGCDPAAAPLAVVNVYHSWGAADRIGKIWDSMFFLFLTYIIHINASWTSDWVDCKWKRICLESNLKHDHRDCQCLEPMWQNLRSAEVDLGAKQKKHQAETSNRAREVGSWRKQKSQTILSPGHVYPCITYGMDSFELQINLSDCVHFAIKKRSWSARFTKFTGRPRRTSSSALASAASSSRLALKVAPWWPQWCRVSISSLSTSLFSSSRVAASHSKKTCACCMLVHVHPVKRIIDLCKEQNENTFISSIGYGSIPINTVF